MSKKLTPWFHEDVKPVHIGEYDYKYPIGYKFRAYWDGAQFLIHDSAQPAHWGQKVAGYKLEGGSHWRGRIKP